MATQPSPLLRAVRQIGGALLDGAAPRRCGLCGRFDTFLCAGCAERLPRAEPPRCPSCWGAPGPHGACRSCAAELVQTLAGVRSAYRLEDGARDLVHLLKYDGLSTLAEPMGKMMADVVVAWGIRPDVVAPVPLHRRRERHRGFNQSARLAHACAETVGLPIEPDVLRRVRATAPQARASGVEARRANVAGAFAVRGIAAGRTVLLVDDVCTTGATLRACGGALRAVGARAVYGLTFARED